MSVPSSCNNTRSKSVAKWYNCLINEFVKQIILYHRQNGLLSWHCIGQLLRVSLMMVFQHSTSHIIIYWHIHMVYFLLFLHQNCSLVTGSLRKLLLSSNGCNFWTIVNIMTKFALYVARILCESCKFGEKICYSNWDNDFFLRDCFFIGTPCRCSSLNISFHSRAGASPWEPCPTEMESAYTCRILVSPYIEFYGDTCRSVITLMITLKPGPNPNTNPKPTYPTTTG